MKKMLLICFVLFLVPCFLVIGIEVLYLLPGEFGNDVFDENTVGIVDVILRDQHDPDAPLLYRAVGPGRAAKTIGPFQSDPLRIYHLVQEYELITAADGFQRRLTDDWLEDESGSIMEITPVYRRVLNLAAQNDHDILKTYILQQDEHLFAAVELNVNLWTPCVLYYYDAEDDTLIELITQDSRDYIGMRMRNLDNIEK